MHAAKPGVHLITRTIWRNLILPPFAPDQVLGLVVVSHDFGQIQVFGPFSRTIGTRYPPSEGPLTGGATSWSSLTISSSHL